MQGWIHTHSVTVVKVTVITKPLNHGVDSQCDRITDHPIVVDLATQLAETVHTELRRRETLVELRFFRNAIQYATRAATTK